MPTKLANIVGMMNTQIQPLSQTMWDVLYALNWDEVHPMGHIINGRRVTVTLDALARRGLASPQGCWHITSLGEAVLTGSIDEVDDI